MKNYKVKYTDSNGVKCSIKVTADSFLAACREAKRLRGGRGHYAILIEEDDQYLKQ